MDCRRHDQTPNPFANGTEFDFSDKEKCCLFLVDHGANLNGAGDLDPPLHMAISSGCYQIGIALIKAGVNINAVSNDTGWTPLHYAYPLPSSRRAVESSGSWRDELISAYFEMFPEKRPKSCAMRCYRHSPIAEFLIKNGADVNTKNTKKHNLTPFHVAIKNEEG